MAMLEPISLPPVDYYDRHRDSRIMNHQFESSQIMMALFKFCKGPYKVLKAPVSLEQLSHQPGGLSATLSVKNNDLQEVLTRPIMVIDGLWTPTEDAEFNVIVGNREQRHETEEAYFQDYDDGLGLEILLGSKANELAFS